MLRGALRRIAILVAVIVGLTAAGSLALGALAGASLLRALADGFYLVGAAVLIGSFVLGMRGPVRTEWGEGEGEMPSSATMRGGLLGPILPRSIRPTTAGERKESRRNSLALFVLGLVLILVGAGFDPSRRPF